MSELRRRLTPTGPLWRHRDFMRLWTGQSISELGSQVSQLAIPWIAAVVLHVSPLVFSLLGVLGLLAVQFVVGIFTVFFDVAYQSYLPSLVEREHLIEGNAKLQLTVSVSGAAGPSMAGGLIAALTAPYAIVADAISYVISTAFMVRIRKPETLPERTADTPQPAMWPELKEGLRWVVGNKYLRSIAACTASANFFGGLYFAIFILYAVRSLHLSSVQVGLVFAAGSVGAIAGALTVNRLQLVIGVGPAIVGAAVLSSTGGVLIPLAPRSFPVPVLIAGFFVVQFGAVAYNVTQVSLRQAITAERLQGRMNAAMRWIIWGTVPFGTLTGGGLASAFGLRTALWIGAIGAIFTFLFVALSPVRTIRKMPEPAVEPTAAQAEMAGGIVEPAPMIAEPGPAASDA